MVASAALLASYPRLQQVAGIEAGHLVASPTHTKEAKAHVNVA